MSQDSAHPVSPLAVAIDAQPVESHRFLLFTIFKWKGVILALGLLLAIAAGIAVLLQPAVYSATAKILLKTDRAALQVSGLASSANRSPSTELLQTEVEFFGSSAVLLPVVRGLRAASGAPADVPDSQLEGAVKRLRGSLMVTPVPYTTVLQVTHSAASRHEAVRTLGLIVDHYIEQHAIAYSGAAGLTTFYEREMEQASQDLRQAEDRVRQWQATHNIVTVDGELNSQVTIRGMIDTNLKRTDAEIEATRGHIASLKQLIAAQPERSVASRLHVVNPLIEKLKSDLAAVEAAARKEPPHITKLKADLLAAQVEVHTLYDPERRLPEKLERIAQLEHELAEAEREERAMVREQMASLKAQLAAAERESEIMNSQTITPNPLREGLVRELASAQSRLPSLISQRDAYRGQMREAEAALIALQGMRVDFERLTRQVDTSKELYLANTKRLDDARIVAGLEKKQLSNVAVIEAPHAAGGGRSLNRQMAIVGLAAVVGLGLGVAVAFAVELFNGSLRTPEDVEFHLGIPVLAVVPAIAESRRALPPFPPAAETVPGERDSHR